MSRILFALGALSALLGVAAGAFAAHGLRELLSPERLEVFQTAARYQLLHALGLLALALAAERWPGALWGWSGGLLLVGTLLFSGSLYALAATGVRGWGAVTPFGGASFLAGWACAAWAVLRAGGG